MTLYEVYPKSGTYILIIYDLRVPGTAVRLLREIEAWRDHADVEAVDDYHFAMLIRPGLASRMALQELLNKRGIA